MNTDPNRDTSSSEAVIWNGPGPLGVPAAFDSMVGVAAPLLAGFGLALLGVVGQAPTSFRWPGATMTMLLTACILFVAAMQFGFRGRARLYNRADIEAWGQLKPAPASETATLDNERFRAQVQANDLARWRRWYRASQLTYNSGITLIAVSAALVLVPPSAASTGETAWRWIGAGIGILAALAELTWILAEELGARRRARTSRRKPEASPPSAVTSHNPVPESQSRASTQTASRPEVFTPMTSEIEPNLPDAPGGERAMAPLLALCPHQVAVQECPRCNPPRNDDAEDD
jgi:hypothetical protein